MNLVLLGAPGAGKGTQAVKIGEKYGWPHVSTGDILRENVRESTALGLEAKKYMDGGELVPDQLVIDLVMGRLSQPDAAGGFILDGFPRTVAQADALTSALAAKGTDIELVLNIDVPLEELVGRLSSRYSCRACGAVFSSLLNPSLADMPCGSCGDELYQRDDDSPETVRNRLKVYEQQTAPLIDYYRGRGILRDVNGTSSVDDVWLEIQSTIDAAR
jgi:adenylate kinase